MNYEQPIEHENYLIFSAAQALRSSLRQQIFTHLTARNNLSFNELLNLLEISRSKLAYHLQIMIENNIITNFYDKRAGVKDHSFYELSAFGQEIRMGRMGKMDNIGKMDKKSLKIIEKPNTLDTHETPEISERPVKPEEPDENNETIREEKTTTKYEKPLSANFRTIRHPEFKKYENLSVKLSKNSIAPIKKERIEYTDPFLNLRVIKRTGNLKVREKHNLPTPRQFYILHKQPFKTKNKVEPKY